MLRSPIGDKRNSVENKNPDNCSASSDEEGTNEIIPSIESEPVGPTQKVACIIQLPGESDGGRSDSEDRLKAFWTEEAEKIRRQIAPLPCRCKRMSEIVTELVAEAEEWRTLRIKEQLRWEDEKEQFERVIEELNAERKWAREKPDGTAVVDETSKGSDGNNNEAIGRHPRLGDGRNERPRDESDGLPTDVVAVGYQRPLVMPAEERRGRHSIDTQESPGALSENEWQ